MTRWSIDIVRQSGWDLWVYVCLTASLILLLYLCLGNAVRRSRSTFFLAMIGVVGTGIVVAVPALHSAKVGIVWTFVLLSLLTAVFHLNLRPQLGLLRTGVLLGMRTGAVALLVPMLFEPVVRFVSVARPQRPMLVLIDSSGSMSFPDAQNGPTRLQSVWQALRPQVDKLHQHFVPSFFTFDNRFRPLQRPGDLATLAADGVSTDIVKAVTSAIAQSKRDDAVIVLVSDGIDNTSSNVVDALRPIARPIHTLRVGSDQVEPATVANVAVDDVEVPDDFVVSHTSVVKATIKSTALANRVLGVNLSEIDATGKAIGEMHSEKLVLQPTAQGQTVSFAYKPAAVGVHRLAVWVDPIAGERSTIDNRQEVQGLAVDPRIKVIYIEGRARPEYRELSRALARDPNIELATLLRVQRERFAASGTVDGQPFKQMPASAAEWAKFDVVILGDLDISFLSPPQQQLIEQRASAGGGLLMIGGQNSFGPGGFQNTPIEKALPVFTGDLTAAQEKSEFVPRLTADGASHPIMEGLADWFATDDKPAAKILPTLRGNVVVPRPKSGAQVLLIHQEKPGPQGSPQIVLASQMYGQGRSAAVTVDTTYLWYLPLRGLGQDSPYNRLWGQLVRWLAGQDVRNRQRGAGLTALLNKNVYQLGESVKVRAMVRDERGDATRFAQVNLTIKSSIEKETRQYSLAPSDTHAGTYELILPSPPTGDYQIELAAAKDAKELGREKLAFTVIAPADEMLKIAANPKLLTAIAEQTHGFAYELGQFRQLIDELIRADTTTAPPQQRSVPLSSYLRAAGALAGFNPSWPGTYDLPMQGMLALVLLSLEWLLRRRWQLP